MILERTFDCLERVLPRPSKNLQLTKTTFLTTWISQLIVSFRGPVTWWLHIELPSHRSVAQTEDWARSTQLFHLFRRSVNVYQACFATKL
ncbi:hypothetical protein TNCV_29741 [Trichonephila clavipes]|nr:hypothetical protein TNCV_29741 [Trichonephila clavipes]